MKFLKNIVICLSIISIVTIYLASNPVKVYAQVPNSKIVQKHDGAWGSYAFDYSLQGKYFTIQDSTGIPTSNYLNAQYFYTDDNITFYALEGKDLYTAILNRGIGIIVKSDYLTMLYESFMSSVGSVVDTTNLAYLQGALYDNNNVFLGYCVNDISGCYYQQPQPANTPAIDIPSELTNDVYNHYQYYTADLYPDFITYYPPSFDYLSGQTYFQAGANQTNYNNALASFWSSLDSNHLYKGYQFNNDYKIVSFQDNDPDHYIYYENTSNSYTYTNWNNFCDELKITKDAPELLFTDLKDHSFSTANYIDFYPYDSNNDAYYYSATYYWNGSQFGTISNPNNGVYSQSKFTLGYTSYSSGYQYLNGNYTFTPFGTTITIYKSQDSFNGIKNQTYIADSYNSDSYNNYNTTNDNSFTITYNLVDNSTTTNSEIYNNISDSYYDNVDNSTVNTQNISNNTTTIINNYYQDNGSGEGGEGGGGSDNPDDDINDDTVLSALLEAIRRFFHIIGELLGTILTGLLDIINEILIAITGIMDNFTGISDLFASLLGWLPSPIPEVLGIGVSICVLFAVLHFIRG